MNEWLRCRPWIEGALEHCGGTHTIEDIEDGLSKGLLQFWPGQRSAIVTEVLQYPRLKALNYFLLGGDLSELKEMEPRISAWAKAQGCSRVIGIGRKGFERVFKDAGFVPRWYFISREI